MDFTLPLDKVGRECYKFILILLMKLKNTGKIPGREESITAIHYMTTAVFRTGKNAAKGKNS